MAAKKEQPTKKAKKPKAPKPLHKQNYEEFCKINDKSQQTWILHNLGITQEYIAVILRISKNDVLQHINDYMSVGIPPYNPQIHTIKKWKNAFNHIMRVGYR